MNKRLLGVSLLSAILFTSCQKDDSPAYIDQQQSDFSISTNASELQKSISFDETGVIGVATINNNRAMEAGEIFGIEEIRNTEIVEEARGEQPIDGELSEEFRIRDKVRTLARFCTRENHCTIHRHPFEDG